MHGLFIAADELYHRESFINKDLFRFFMKLVGSTSARKFL